MKRLKILGLLLIFTIFGCSAASAQNGNLKTWKITATKSGGFAGINHINTLDSDGNLNRIVKRREVLITVEQAKVAEIGRLIKELKLRGTKQKSVKGRRIYDGIYTRLVITLDGKDYKIEGSSFDDAKYLALSNKQKVTLEKLKAKLNELGDFLFN